MEMKIKDFIYKYSIRLFILIVAYLIVSFPFQYTQEKMNDVSQPVRWLGTLLFFIIACFIVRYRKKLETVFAKKSLFFIIFVMIFALQLMTIYVFKIQPVNDLLYLHDEAIRMIQNPMFWWVFCTLSE
jgi:membrane-associated HD superfamily phosphohydrolase